MATLYATGTNAASADIAVPALIKQLENAPQLFRAAIGDIAAALQVECKRTMDRQQDAYGNPWPLTKQGYPALVTASQWLIARRKGNAVRLVVRGYMGLHDLGRARGRVQRRMLPTVAGGLPARWSAEIQRVVEYHLVRAFPS